MRVALLSRAVFPVHGFGGLERHVAALEKHLTLAGCEVTLFTAMPVNGLGAERERTEFVRYRTIPWPRGKGFAIVDRDTNYLRWSIEAARRVLAGERFDIVQADGGAGFGYAVLAGPGAPPFVLHPHGMEEFKAPPLKRSLYLPLRSATRFAARRAVRVLAPDASMKEEVKRILGVEEARVAVVPNAIDLAEIDRNASPIDLGLPPGARVLLSVGRLEANKGFADLAGSLASLPGDVFWVLVGEGPERARIESSIARSRVASRVRLTGRVPDEALHALYERCELFVHPTRYEGSSMTTLEAMAHGRAVVATAVGGIPDKVRSGENGLLVPPGDTDAMTSAIAEALSDPERLSRWGAKSRAAVEERFDWSRRVQDLLDLYQTILRKSR